MRAKRKFARQSVLANVVSLAAYREAHTRAADATAAAPAALQPAQSEMGLLDLYWRWLALTGAMWTFWW
jgi:hypothetical protein